MSEESIYDERKTAQSFARKNESRRSVADGGFSFSENASYQIAVGSIEHGNFRGCLRARLQGVDETPIARERVSVFVRELLHLVRVFSRLLLLVVAMHPFFRRP